MTHKYRYVGHCVICLKIHGEAVAVQKGKRDHERYCVKRGHKVSGRSNDIHLIEEHRRARECDKTSKKAIQPWEMINPRR